MNMGYIPKDARWYLAANEKINKASLAVLSSLSLVRKALGSTG